MSGHRKNNTTKLEIIQVATRMFLEKGYTGTSVKAISDALGISTGNLTFYFPTKEHMLAVLVEMLCDFQWKIMEQFSEEGYSSLMTLCLELPAMAAICEENEIARDFYLSAYMHPMTLNIIRKSDAEKAKMVFGEFCPQWGDREYMEAEILVSGMEYATLMTSSEDLPLDVRVAGALHGILMMYNVPLELRDAKIQKVLNSDYRSVGRQILKSFMAYIEEVNESALEALKRS